MKTKPQRHCSPQLLPPGNSGINGVSGDTLLCKRKKEPKGEGEDSVTETEVQYEGTDGSSPRGKCSVDERAQVRFSFSNTREHQKFLLLFLRAVMNLLAVAVFLTQTASKTFPHSLTAPYIMRIV